MNELKLNTVQQLNDKLLTKPKTQIERRLAILALEDAMCNQGMKIEDVNSQDPAVCLTPVKHHFSNGVYMREMFIPAGTLLTGALHITEHQVIMISGDIIVYNEFGVRRWQGYNNFTSLIGEKRLGYAIEDTIWITVHSNIDHITDPDEMMNTFSRRNENDLYKEYLLIEDQIPSVNNLYSLTYNRGVI